MTKAGVEYDLAKSPYKWEIDINSEPIVFKFSSPYNLRRFREKIMQETDKLESYLTNLIGVSIDCHVIACIKLYLKIEKRGFFIEKGGEIWIWPEEVKVYSGLKTNVNN